jgi:hypothetical protein
MATITSVSPAAGTAGTVVTVRGSGFNTETPAANQVTFGGTAAVEITVVSASELRVTLPVTAAHGPADAAVSADGGLTWATLAKGCYLLATAQATTPGHLVQGGARAVFIDGRPVGFTDAPVKLAHERVHAEAEVEQELGAVQLFPRLERWRLTLSLAEVHLENLQVVFGGAIVEDGGGRRLSLGGDAGTTEHSLLVQGPGSHGTARDFYVYRAVVETHEPLLIARDAPQRLPVTFRLLPEMSLPAGSRVVRIVEG